MDNFDNNLTDAELEQYYAGMNHETDNDDTEDLGVSGDCGALWNAIDAFVMELIQSLWDCGFESV